MKSHDVLMWRRLMALACVPAGITLAVLAILGWQGRIGGTAIPAQFDSLYEQALSKPAVPFRVFHIGHSLVGRDMPAMLAQLAGDGHAYESQLGWGTSMREHWEPALAVNGFDSENDHPRFRAAREAVGSGDYDALILTEMVEIKDAIRYHRSADYLARWAASAWSAKASTRVYLYETWHPIDDAEGWLERLDRDLQAHWETEILYPALGKVKGNAIYVIPAGQVLARFARELETQGRLGSITRRDELFTDTIHLSDLGAYLVALTHFAVLYHRNPVGLPHSLKRADGSDANAPDAEAALAMQKLVWAVVTSYRKTGVMSDDA